MARTFILVMLASANFVFANVTPRVQSFVDHEIVPDVLSTPPASLLSVIFPTGVEAQEGNEVPLSQVIDAPTLVWDASPDRFYTLIFCDADAPSRVNPESRSFLHWLVVNIPGDDVIAGDTVANFINSQPSFGTGPHRYMFLIYEQPEEMSFEELPDVEGRAGFSPEGFATRYNLGTAIAGNFYLAENSEDGK